MQFFTAWNWYWEIKSKDWVDSWEFNKDIRWFLKLDSRDSWEFKLVFLRQRFRGRKGFKTSESK